MHFSGSTKRNEPWKPGRHIAPAPDGALEPWKAALAAACGPLSLRATWRAGFRLRAQLERALTAQPFYRDDFVRGEATEGLCLLVALSGSYSWAVEPWDDKPYRVDVPPGGFLLLDGAVRRAGTHRQGPEASPVVLTEGAAACVLAMIEGNAAPAGLPDAYVFTPDHPYDGVKKSARRSAASGGGGGHKVG
ncbi:hypothetical protein JKP88DRAFT_214153 [Tribonema minus]|uniref:Uncharacterized protein n=1 Tax=Tribonema minus TaxID=303371 RepID=A0A836CRF2_9STRA|nr:hypothetical protein JKP88DRAFT_214153 [Tribonema minus]